MQANEIGSLDDAHWDMVDVSTQGLCQRRRPVGVHFCTLKGLCSSMLETWLLGRQWAMQCHWTRSEPRSATAMAITDVELVPISEKQFLLPNPVFRSQGHEDPRTTTEGDK
jgi:CRP-like cAMP-binding protein